MSALKYPVGYRTKAARELSMPANANQNSPRIPPSQPSPYIRPPVEAPAPANDNGPVRRPAKPNPINWGAEARTIYRYARRAMRKGIGRLDIRANIALDLIDALLEPAMGYAPSGPPVFIPTDALGGEWEWRSYGASGAGKLSGAALTQHGFDNLWDGSSAITWDTIIMQERLYPAKAPRPWPVNGWLSGQFITPAPPNYKFDRLLMLAEPSSFIGSRWRFRLMNGYARTVPAPAGGLEIVWKPQYDYAPVTAPMTWPMAKASLRPGAFRFRPWQPAPRPDAPTPTKPPRLPRVRDDRKFALSFNNRAWYGALVNGTTEVIDLIEVAYNALRKKTGAKTPQDKVKAIYENWATMDWGKFLRGLAANQIEDYIYGRIGQASAAASRRAGRSTGFQTGDWDTSFSYHTRGLGYDNNPISFVTDFIQG